MKTFIHKFLLLAVLPATLAGCGGAAKTDEPKKESVRVKVAEVEYTDFAQPILASGTLVSDKEARLSFKTGGIIAELLVDEGEAVAKGQLLARLNLTEIDAQLGQARNAFEKAERDFKRVSNLYRDSAATLEQFQNAQTGYQLAEQALQIAGFNQRYSSIYATESGRVLRKLMNEGELVGPGQPVYVINSTRPGDWVIRIGLADRDWTRLSLGDEASVWLDAFPGDTLKATVSEIAEAADPFTGTFAVELRIDAGNRRLASGLVARLRINPSRKEQLGLLPIEAVTTADRTTATLFTLNTDGKTVASRTVTVAHILPDQVAIRTEGEPLHAVVTEGASYLRDGEAVTVIH